MNSTFHPIRAAFTLIELMVSIFLLLLIMIGVNTVFKTTSETVGVGQAQSALIRDSRAIQAVLSQDFTNAASSSPAIIIKSEMRYQFKNAADAASDADGDPATADFTGSGAETQLPSTIYNSRVHRLDRISFFTQQSIRRQTGNDGTFAANQTSREAWVWLGHLRQPDNSANPPTFVDGSTFDPGVGTAQSNPNNFYAQQWILGRVAMLMATPAGGVINDQSLPTPISQNYYPVTAPFDANMSSTTVGTGTIYSLRQNRYDLLGSSIANYATILNNYITANPTAAWWQNMMTGPITQPSIVADRFCGSQFIPRPLDSSGMAHTAPIMGVGVSQFMVEYAGDFVAQNDDSTSTTYGQVTNVYTNVDANGNPQNDGKIDFTIDFNDASADGQITSPAEKASARKKIRWYGLPRDINGDGAVKGYKAGFNADQLPDVVPLRDIWQTSAVPGVAPYNTHAPFEKITGYVPAPTANDPTILPHDLYSALPLGVSASLNGMQTNEFYTCAWSATDTVRPKLIRITMTLEDPQGKLPDGQTFEYVFALP